MAPPRKNSSRSCRYKGLVDAKVPTKRNSYGKDSANQHFLFARAAYREEFVVKFKEECCMYSCDDMNKIKTDSVIAVSRYHQQFRFFLREYSPNFGDHDFLNPGYLTICSGYQMLQPKPPQEVIEGEYSTYELNDFFNEEDAYKESIEKISDIEGDFFIDKLGRKHFNRFTSGPPRLVLRASIFAKSTAASHAYDLLPMLKAQVNDGKGVAFIKVDNRPAWNLLNIVNKIYFCRFWRDSSLHIFGIVSYAAKYSAYNNIEHTWSPMSRRLSSVVLPSVLEGEEEPPYKQADLTNIERAAKEVQVQ